MDTLYTDARGSPTHTHFTHTHTHSTHITSMSPISSGPPVSVTNKHFKGPRIVFIVNVLIIVPASVRTPSFITPIIILIMFTGAINRKFTELERAYGSRSGPTRTLYPSHKIVLSLCHSLK